MKTMFALEMAELLFSWKSASQEKIGLGELLGARGPAFLVCEFYAVFHCVVSVNFTFSGSY